MLSQDVVLVLAAAAAVVVGASLATSAGTASMETMDTGSRIPDRNLVRQSPFP